MATHVTRNEQLSRVSHRTAIPSANHVSHGGRSVLDGSFQLSLPLNARNTTTVSVALNPSYIEQHNHTKKHVAALPMPFHLEVQHSSLARIGPTLDDSHPSRSTEDSVERLVRIDGCDDVREDLVGACAG